MKLDELLDSKELEQLVNDRLVGVQHHPSLPLRIFNYTQTAQFAQKWGGAIDFCRGLIVDDDNNIVARPFKKFHTFRLRIFPKLGKRIYPKRCLPLPRNTMGLWVFIGGMMV